MSFIATRDGTKLHVEEWGKGRPLVLVHGWAIGAESWEYLVTALAKRDFRCIAYDKRGCGKSDRPPSGYDFDTFADDLGAVLDGVGDAAVVAHSMGAGDLVRHFSRGGGRHVERAVLLAPTTPCIARRDDNPDGFPQAFYAETIAEMERDRPNYLMSQAPPFFGVPVSRELMEWGVGLLLRASPHASSAMMRAQAETDFRADCPRVSVPTLILHGDADLGTPLELCGRRTQRLIPGARLVVVEKAAHALMITHAERLADEIAKFQGEGR